ncbi:hypothetical protein QQP08_025251 [Theobroma cacao]|nr:hypothetical protein QQP08_025251 [Theobroma cacao]
MTKVEIPRKKLVSPWESELTKKVVTYFGTREGAPSIRGHVEGNIEKKVAVVVHSVASSMIQSNSNIETDRQ